MKLDEGGLSRVISRAKNKKQSHATVSAERGDKSKKENKSRSKQLEKDLRGRGYGPKKTTGTYSEKDSETGKENKVKERSYFVTSGKKSKRKFKKDMKKVAAKHSQDSVLVKQKGSSSAKLHATRKGGLGKSKSETAGKLKAKKGEFSTQVGKKHMTYESILDKAEILRQEFAEGKKKGLWDNIHAKRKRGEAPAKKGDKDYPETLNVEGKAYGITKGSGKPSGAMKNFLDKRYDKKKVSPGKGIAAKVKHDCSSKVKHEEYGVGDCIKEMHTLDEYGDITHYDVLFNHGVERNVPVNNLEVLVSEMHEHYINHDKNAEVIEAKVDKETPDYKRATARDKRYGNPHGSLELGGGIRKDRRADHEANRGVKTKVKEEMEKNCGCGQDPCVTYGEENKKKRKNALQIQNVVGEMIDPKGAARMDAAKKKKSYDPFAHERRNGKTKLADGRPLPPPPVSEEAKCDHSGKDKECPVHGKKDCSASMDEAKKPMIKVKLKDPKKIKVKVTDIGAGGKEYVRKNEMDEVFNFIKTAKKVVKNYNNKLQQNNDAINKVMPGTASMRNSSSSMKNEHKDPGKYERKGAQVGAALGGAAGAAIPDGPLMVAGELAGGYVGSKIGGRIGKSIDNDKDKQKNSVKKAGVPVKESKNFESFMESAWQRKEGKNKTGGLNEKGRKSYERENPGSDLKAPQPEGGPRKKSFCARMGGVKGPMKKPNGEPSRKALALRKWKC